MARDDDIVKAILRRSVSHIVNIFFEDDRPEIRTGYHSEHNLWDYKRNIPSPRRDKHRYLWARLARDVLGFHNNRGGLLFFGIDDNTYRFSGVTEHVDSKIFNDKVRQYIPDRIYVEYYREFRQADGKYLGIAVIPPRGAILELFEANAPIHNGKRLFLANGTAVRIEDSTKVYSPKEAKALRHARSVPDAQKPYLVDEPYFRLLQPEYKHFVYRENYCANVLQAINDRRCTTTSITGIGGVGKTAIATWAALEMYSTGQFAFILSMTAKDRSLTDFGISSVKPTLTSYESLLDGICEVCQLPEAKSYELEEKSSFVIDILEDSNGLIFVDNLETVDDSRIIEFLNDLPVGVKALVTSRIARVRKSIYPIELDALGNSEAVKYVKTLAEEPGFSYIFDLSDDKILAINSACDGIPLAIRWALSKSRSAGEAVKNANEIANLNAHGEELLEFCFRRLFDNLPHYQKRILQVLSIFTDPLTQEALYIGTGEPSSRILDGAEELFTNTRIVTKQYDSDKNDYVYSIMPIVRSYIYQYGKKYPTIERDIRKRLTDYYEARDIKNAQQRLAVRELRQGKSVSPEQNLVDLAISARSRGDFEAADKLFNNAVKRNPRSWKAAKEYAEFNRHQLENITKALSLYEQAAMNAPSKGHDRSMIFREWGILLKESGRPDGTDRAIEKLEIAFSENPDDAVATHVLATLLNRKGKLQRARELLEPLRDHYTPKTRECALTQLIGIYRKLGDRVEEIKAKADLHDLRDNYAGKL